MVEGQGGYESSCLSSQLYFIVNDGDESDDGDEVDNDAYDNRYNDANGNNNHNDAIDNKYNDDNENTYNDDKGRHKKTVVFFTFSKKN